MRRRIWWNLLFRGRMLLMLRLQRSVRELYRVCFLARAAEIGLLDALCGHMGDLGEIARALGVSSPSQPALAALLDLGVGIGELRRTGGRYGLSGALSKALAIRGDDPLRAMASEVAGLHVPYLLAAPGGQDEAGRLAALTDTFSTVIAQSSRALEPLLTAVAQAVVPPRGPVRLLEIGCGTGVYVRAALRCNPELTATAVERETEVAREAEARLVQAGFAGRFAMVTADVRELAFAEPFDLITLYNNIYYFPEDTRLDLLIKLRSWLRPGGRLVVATPCPGGGPVSRFMLLWSRATAGAGTLPEVEAFSDLLRQAGFGTVSAQSLVPGESYTLFVATNEGL